ncbi:MAG: S53 family peptidase [Terracidiphilus sp.]
MHATSTYRVHAMLSLFAAALLLPNLAPGQSQAPAATPKIGDFVLYAQRSIKIGKRSHTEGGEVGIRSSIAKTPREGAAQLRLEEHAKCGTAYSPSTSMEEDAETGKIWTDSLKRPKDSEIGPEGAFPATLMPPLPLAFASGSGQDIRVEEHNRRDLTPGVYGNVLLEEHSTLRLASGSYTFASVKMKDGSRLLGDAAKGDGREKGVNGLTVKIIAGLQMGREAAIKPDWDDAKAKDFTILVAGSDPTKIEDLQTGLPDSRLTPTTVVSMGREAKVHALLAAPHGTLWMADEAGGKGAFAAFDIELGEHIEIEYESGFPDSSAGQAGTQQLHGYYVVPPAGVAPLAGPVPQDTVIALSIGLPIRNPAALKSLIGQVSDPHSPNFRKYVTQSQFNATYGATTADYQSLQNWAAANGFTTVATFPSNLLLPITATAAQIEQAFYVNLVYRLRADGSKWIAVDREPSLDLGVPLLDVVGFKDTILPKHHLTLNGTGGGGSYRAADIRAAYLGVNSTCQSLTGAGQTVGIVDFDVFQQSDIQGFDALQAPPRNPNLVSIVATEGGNPTSGSNLETTLDVEAVQSMAPGAQIKLFQGSTGITGHLDDILHAMANFSPQLTVASSSISYKPSDSSEQALSQMAALGIAYFDASGDNGDIGDPQDSSRMDNQTLVGGTTLSTNPLTGSPYPVPPALYRSLENTWVQTNPNGATGGGIMDGNNKNGNCDIFCGDPIPLPDYQQGVSMALNGGSTLFRNYPDVAALAQNFEIFFNGASAQIGGTSVAAPLWAGFIALVNERSAQTGGGLPGFLNPTLYDIGKTKGLSVDLSADFNDIADGFNNNQGFGPGFTSVAGYDLTTGWGTPTCALLNQLSSITPLTPNTPVDFVRVTIGTGDDNFGDNNSSGFVTITVPGGASFNGTLRNAGDGKWDNGSTHTVDVAIPNCTTSPCAAGAINPPVTAGGGISSITINLVQSDPGCNTYCDNWDINSLNVSLFNPPVPPNPTACQINLVGSASLQDGSTGLVRLSARPGGSGVGGSASFSAPAGCP